MADFVYQVQIKDDTSNIKATYYFEGAPSGEDIHRTVEEECRTLLPHFQRVAKRWLEVIPPSLHYYPQDVAINPAKWVWDKVSLTIDARKLCKGTKA